MLLNLLAQSGQPMQLALDPIVIIWIIIGFFWIIGSISDGKKKKEMRERQQKQAQARRAARAAQAQQQGQGAQGGAPANTRTVAQSAPPPRPTGPSAPAGPTDLEAQMREMYEQLTGQWPARPAQQPRPAARTQSPPPQRPQQPQAQRPQIQLQRPVQRPTPPPAPARRRPSKPVFVDHTPNTVTSPEEAIKDIKPIREIKEDAFQDIEEVQDILSMEESALDHTGGAHNTVSTKSMMVNLGKMKMPLIRMKNMSLSTVDHPAKKPDLTNKKILRQAIKARVLLEPCKAMQQDNSTADMI